MMKKILLIVQNNSFPWDSRVYKEAASLQSHGYEVFVISPRSSIDSERRENIDNIHVLRYKDNKSNGTILGFVFEYLTSLTKIYFFSLYLVLFKKIKAVHVANPPDFFWPLAFFLYFFKVKFIYDQHDLATLMFRIKFNNPLIRRFVDFSERMTVKFSSGIIVANETFRNRLLGKAWLKDKPCAIVYNGPKSNFKAQFNQALHTKYTGYKVALFVGLMTVNDNVEVIIEAADIIINKFNRREIKFVLVGEGEVKDKLQEFSSKLNVKEYIDFTGLVNASEVMEYIELADVCLAPDQRNGLNEYLTLIKILEYMKLSKPFVAFQLDETMVMAKDSGLYAKDVNDFAHKILYVIDNPEVGYSYGYRGHQRVMRNFLWKHSESMLINFYKTLV